MTKTPRNDAERLRIREATLGIEFSQSGREPWQGMPSLLARTTAIKAYPNSAQGFFACSPLTLLGAEIEGQAGTITAGTSTFFAINVGSAIPPIGTSIVATFVDDRWAFRYDG